MCAFLAVIAVFFAFFDDLPTLGYETIEILVAVIVLGIKRRVFFLLERPSTLWTGRGLVRNQITATRFRTGDESHLEPPFIPNRIIT